MCVCGGGGGGGGGGGVGGGRAVVGGGRLSVCLHFGPAAGEHLHVILVAASSIVLGVVHCEC